MGDSWLAMEACLRLEPSIIHRVVLTTGYRFFDYLKSLPKSIISIISAQRYNRYIFPNPPPLCSQKNHDFRCKIQKFRTFPLIYLHISIFFRTFAAGFLMRTHVHIRTYKGTNAKHSNNGFTKSANRRSRICEP